MKTKREVIDMNRAYQNTFAGDDGKKVLQDILSKAGYFLNLDRLPPEALTARRGVAEHILGRLGYFTPANLDLQIDLLTRLNPISPDEDKETEQ